MPDQKDNKRATLVDVARLAKVSTSAVSRTFTPGASVSKKTKARVIKAADELAFRPNILARSLMTGRSALIALVSNAFSNPYVMSIIDAFTQELQHRNLRPLVFNLSASFDESETIALMSQYQIDGIVIASSTFKPDFVDLVCNTKIPVVIAFGRAQPGTHVSSVYVDNLQGGRTAARQLVERGYKQIGFIGAPEHVTTSDDRLRGFREELALSKRSPPAVIHAKEYSHTAGRRAISELLDKFPKTDSVFCADDQIALGALDGAKYDCGRKIPEFGVIGFNDIPTASWPPYELATFRTHTDQVVRNAIELLELQIDQGPKPAEKRIVSCEFVSRQSVRQIQS